jgi:hypothetical protein
MQTSRPLALRVRTEALTQRQEVAVQDSQAPTMAALIGAWRTEGEVFGEDGRTVVATVAGSDVYEELGPTVGHHVDVEIGGDRTRALEVFEPYDVERGAFPCSTAATGPAGPRRRPWLRAAGARVR